MRNFLVILLLFLAAILVFNNSFNTFFVQDDFILAAEFSQSNFREDLVNVFSLPNVSHWRPLHNLYFFITGNLFGRNFVFYHLLTLFLHTAVAFVIYLISKKLTANNFSSLIAALIYAVHPSHFVSIFWISGAATTIGLLFLLLSFNFYVNNKKSVALILFVSSLLASEAMIVGLGLFFVYEFLFLKKKKVQRAFLVQTSIITLIFILVKITYLIPSETFDTYQFRLSESTAVAIKFYALRILGFAETSGDLIVSIFLTSLLLAVGYLLVNKFREGLKRQSIYFYSFISAVGLFPFILIPDHLSPHYMNLSIWGFSVLLAIAVADLDKLKKILVILAFIILSMVSVNKTEENNWVTQRSKLSRTYLSQIESANLPKLSKISFRDSSYSSSKEAYIVLGEGKGVDFWFRDKMYVLCFTAYENCSGDNFRI